MANRVAQLMGMEKQAPRYYKRYPAHKVAVSEETDGSDEEYVFVVSPARTQTKLSVPQAHVKIHCTMIDSGAHVNVLDETAYKRLSDCKLSYTAAKIHPYQCDKPVLGKFSSEVAVGMHVFHISSIVKEV